MQQSMIIYVGYSNEVYILFEAGLHSKWFNDQKYTINSPSTFQSSTKLGIRHLSFGICLIYLPFIFGSCLTFCFEYITFQYKNKSKTHWIWKYFDQFCDGYRYYLQNLPKRWQENVD